MHDQKFELTDVPGIVANVEDATITIDAVEQPAIDANARTTETNTEENI